MKLQYPLLVIRGGIYDDTLTAVDEKLADSDGQLIYVLIESLGGDPSSGYRIMRLIQAKYRKIVAVIPSEAYSTATLMALGADEIYMRKSACLGPLDIQVKHPTDGSTISSLEIRDTLNTLAGSLTTYAQDFFETLKTDMKLGKKDAADLAMRTATDLTKPIAEKIDPIYLQASTRSSKVGQKYAERLLTARMMKTNPQLARLVSTYLANNYDYHGYAIMLEEASQLLALNVEDVTKLQTWNKIKDVYHKIQSVGVYLENIEVDEEQKKPQNGDASNAKIKKEKESAS